MNGFSLELLLPKEAWWTSRTACLGTLVALRIVVPGGGVPWVMGWWGGTDHGAAPWPPSGYRPVPNSAQNSKKFQEIHRFSSIFMKFHVFHDRPDPLMLLRGLINPDFSLNSKKNTELRVLKDTLSARETRKNSKITENHGKSWNLSIYAHRTDRNGQGRHVWLACVPFWKWRVFFDPFVRKCSRWLTDGGFLLL